MDKTDMKQRCDTHNNILRKIPAFALVIFMAAAFSFYPVNATASEEENTEAVQTTAAETDDAVQDETLAADQDENVQEEVPEEETQSEEVQSGDAESGELIVVYEDSRKGERAAENAADTLDSEFSVEDTDVLADSTDNSGEVQMLTLEDESNVEDAIEEMEKIPGVAYAQKNFRYYLLEGTDSANPLPNDKRLSRQYYLNGWDSTFQNDCGANIKEAWSEMDDTGSVSVAVIDTGCDLSHEDLQGNIDRTNAYDVIRNTHKVRDSHGHGTNVCGLIGATANNEKGVAGIGDNHARVIPICVYADGSILTSSLIKAFQYLKSRKIKNLRVINMSLGRYETDESIDEDSGQQRDIVFEQAISEMRSRGVLTVCAAGNGDDSGMGVTDKIYPGDFDECMCVCALDRKGNNADFSDYNMYKDISTAGENIYTTFSGGWYNYNKGTSFSSPIVAGIAALMWVDDSNLTVDQVVRAIEATAHPINKEYYGDRETGSAGAIDARAAMDYFPKLNDAELTVENTDFTYNGKAKTPEVTVVYNGKQLVKGRDYKVKYSANVSPGTGKLTVNGIGDYSGVNSASFSIKLPKLENLNAKARTTTSLRISWNKASNISGYKVYSSKNGKHKLLKKIKSSKTLGNTRTGLSPSSTHTYAVRTYKVINGKTYNGPYCEVKGVTKPKRVIWGSLSSGMNTPDGTDNHYIKAKWQKRSGSGYQVKIARNSSFSNSAESILIEGSGKLTATFNGLAKGKRYYVKVRAYKSCNGTRCYGKYSKIKSITVK